MRPFADFLGPAIDPIHKCQDFRDAWLPDLESNGFLVGVNWSGKGASGYDLSPADVLAGLAAAETASQH